MMRLRKYRLSHPCSPGVDFFLAWAATSGTGIAHADAGVESIPDPPMFLRSLIAGDNDSCRARRNFRGGRNLRTVSIEQVLEIIATQIPEALLDLVVPVTIAS